MKFACNLNTGVDGKAASVPGRRKTDRNEHY
jgi:hypothetical protein